MDYIEISAKTVDDAITDACQKFTVTSDKLEYEVVDEGKTGLLGIGARPAVIKDVFAAMDLTVVANISYNEEENAMDIELSGDEMGILIGKRGQTLDSLQYLVSLVVNKDTENYVRVKVDTENYRKRRKETLENLARNISYKVKRTKRPVSLEPMNPYERRIIHSALQNDKYVTTYSEGDEPFRHVVVVLKKYERNEKRYDKGYEKSYYNKEDE